MPFEKLSSKRAGEPSEKVRQRVEAARVIQRERFDGTGLQTNADSAQPRRGMGPGEIRQYCTLDETSTNTHRAPSA